MQNAQTKKDAIIYLLQKDETRERVWKILKYEIKGREINKSTSKVQANTLDEQNLMGLGRR